jgi:hypothetical protein
MRRSPQCLARGLEHSLQKSKYSQGYFISSISTFGPWNVNVVSRQRRRRPASRLAARMLSAL